MDPADIVIEVTESRLLEELTSSIEVLTRLRLNDITLSIDDFGTGYSSMEQLKNIPFTELKIDRVFVHDAAQDSAALALLDSSISLGHDLGMTIVAEGIENQEDWDLIAGKGCHQAQGYFLTKPLPADEFEAWLARHDSSTRN